MSRVFALFVAMVFGMLGSLGCAQGTPAAAPASGPVPLDGRTFHVAVTADERPRGGLGSEDLDITFEGGRLVAKDAHDLGYAGAPYVTRRVREGIEFEAEAPSPLGVRRFKGRVTDGRIEGTLVLVRDGALPEHATFGGKVTDDDARQPGLFAQRNPPSANR
jgi:hypothetical protein